MDRYQLDELLQRIPPVQTTVPSIIAYAIGALLVLHQVLVYLDVAVLSPLEVAWNAVVHLVPTILLLDRSKREELRIQQSTRSQIHAAKSESFRNMLGLGSRAVMQQLPVGASLIRNIGTAKSKPKSDAPPGLGNWDNSCYQNSVLQGLSAVESLKPYLSSFSSHKALPTDSTSSSLQQIVQKLNDAANNGNHIWTPAKLKSMSSWQQQDAQEYYSKIVDDLEKEASKVFGAAAVKPGLESAEKKKGDIAAQMAAPPFSVPLEGLLAQRVACTKCGFSEGLSMIPFNCLTVPLGSGYEYDLADCLNEYTKIEDISEVECAKCTLLKAKVDMKRMLGPAEEEEKPVEAKKVMQLPPKLRENLMERLKAVETALEADDFSDKTLKETCQISKKARVSSTKTRQAIVGRAPRGLVIHVNRSVFDEMTGAQRKNYAAVRYPQVLDLGKWMLGVKDASEKLSPEAAISEASQSMLAIRSYHDQCLYRLKAVITHYGRHENGHYIAYRQHPSEAAESDGSAENDITVEADESPCNTEVKMPWWRLSDEDVSSVPDEDVLQQGGVFMLFYEREEETVDTSTATSGDEITEEKQTESDIPTTESKVQVEEKNNAPQDEPSSIEVASKDVTSEPSPATSAVVNHESEPSTDTNTEGESDAENDDAPMTAAKPASVPTQPPMRTAGVDSAQKDSGFPSPHRVIAAT